MKKILFICILVAMISCSEKKQNSPPANVIPKEQFAQVLADVRLLEGAYASRYTRIDTSALKIDSYYEKLFQERGITRDQFRSSFNYYLKDVSLMSSIENELLNKFTLMQIEQDSLNKMANKVVLDSVTKIQRPAIP